MSTAHWQRQAGRYPASGAPRADGARPGARFTVRALRIPGGSKSSRVPAPALMPLDHARMPAPGARSRPVLYLRRDGDLRRTGTMSPSATGRLATVTAGGPLPRLFVAVQMQASLVRFGPDDRQDTGATA